MREVRLVVLSVSFFFPFDILVFLFLSSSESMLNSGVTWQAGSPPPSPLRLLPWQAFLSPEHFSPVLPRRLSPKCAYVASLLPTAFLDFQTKAKVSHTIFE